MNFINYQINGCFDEFFNSAGIPRHAALPLIEKINSLPIHALKQYQNAANLILERLGITFGVYTHKDSPEKIFPFDIIPRIIAADEWQQLELGLKQRITALNLFLQDIYSEEKIIKDKIIPQELIYSASAYRPFLKGFVPPGNIWIHITGTDLVRDKQGTFYVLEDNLRCPSGISYVLDNRAILKRIFPDMFGTMQVSNVNNYCEKLYNNLRNLKTTANKSKNIVLLTPGIYNSAYFEHCFLAKQMGIELVEGKDLKIIDGKVMMSTTHGFEPVDVIYRRIDDDFLDPQVFRKDSLLGVPGLMDCYVNGQVAIANAPGCGVADDKAVYAYVPQIIKYYLDEDPILPNVPTYLCHDPQQLNYVLDNLEQLVVKSVNLAGGYGMLIGCQSTAAERQQFAMAIKANPRNYIAQPIIDLSCAPTIIDHQLQPRHVDLRPYILFGEDVFVLPGGLTRVALVKDSLVVNSSQGGGSKDTWVLKD